MKPQETDNIQQPAVRSSDRRTSWFMLIILLLAFGLRIYRLDFQSFWNDEGNSARIAERSIQLILEGSAADIHPPLYYLALHTWRVLMGDSEFALRFFSVIGGLLLSALTYTLGLRLDLFRPAATGLAAALASAINPFQVYYSQEARSYIWVALLGAGAIYSGIRFLESHNVKKRNWAAGYVLVTAAGLYTHYLFPISLIPLGVIAAASTFRQKAWRHLAEFLTLNLLAGLLYLPWAPIGISQLLGWPTQVTQISIGQALLETWRTLTLGSTITTRESTFALAGFGLVLLLGMIPNIRHRHAFVNHQPKKEHAHSPNTILALVILWLLVPIVLVFALNLFKPAFLKFLLIASPAVCLLLGRGTTWPFSSRRLTPILFALALSIGLILSFCFESLENIYHDPTYARADYRGMAGAIMQNAKPGDAVVLNAANQWEVFTYYYLYPEQTYPLPKSRPVNEAMVMAQLKDITAQHDRIYAIFWAENESDPERLVERWLDAHTYKAADQWWGDVRLVIYALTDETAAELTVPLDVLAGDSIQLLGYSLTRDHLQPGDIIQVTLFWQAVSPINQRYKVFIHLLDSNGVLTAQRDSEPGGGSNPTDTWALDETQIDNYGILVPLGTAPGEYSLKVGLYPPDDPTSRLFFTIDGQQSGAELQLQPIIITAP